MYSEKVLVIKVLGVPFHYGQKNKNVADGPDVLRALGLIELLKGFDDVIDLQNLSFDKIDLEPDRIAEACLLIHEKVSTEWDDSFMLAIGGDHGMSLGSISGILSKDPHRVVIWVDAHADLNTPESSQSKNFHGMPLSYLLGLNRHEKDFDWIKSFLLPEKLIYFGPRDLDPFERELIQKLGIQCHSSSDINEKGVEVLLRESLHSIDPLGEFNIHLSFDLDVFDEKDFSATGIALPGGPCVSEMLKLVSILNKTKRLKSMDLVEFLPVLQDGQSSAQQLIFSLLSKLYS